MRLLREWRDGVDGDAEGLLRDVKHPSSVFPADADVCTSEHVFGGYWHRRLQDPSATDGQWTGRAALREALHAKLIKPCTGIPYSSRLECRSGESSSWTDCYCVVVLEIASWQEHSFAGCYPFSYRDRKVQCISSTIFHLTDFADFANTWASTFAYGTSDGAATAQTFNFRLHPPYCTA